MTDHSLSNTTAFDSQEEKEETVKSEAYIYGRALLVGPQYCVRSSPVRCRPSEHRGRAFEWYLRTVVQTVVLTVSLLDSVRSTSMCALS